MRERSDVTAGDEIVSMMNGEKFAKTNEHRRCERVAEKLGMPVEWYAGAANENGYYQNGTIYLNMNSPEPFMFIFKHEFTHHLESSKWYNEFVSYVEGTELYLNWIANKGGKTAYANSIKSDYAKAGKACDVQHEIIANFVGEKLLGGKGGLSIGTDGEVINTDIMVERELYKFAKEKPTIFDSIIDHIRTIIAKLRQYFGKTSGFNSENELNAIYRYLVHMKETANGKANSGDVVFADGGVSYSIAYTTDNKPVAVIDEDILDGVPKSQWIQTVKDTILGKFSDGIPISGRLIKVNQKTRNEYTNSKNSQWYANNNQVVYADKFKSANSLDDIVLASTNYINEDLKHKRNDKFKEFARGDVLIRVGSRDYSAKVIVGFTSGQQMVLYDVIDFSPVTLKLKTDMRSPSNRTIAENGSNISVSDTTVPQKEQSVNNYSMQEGEKNSLENEKQFSISNVDNEISTKYNTYGGEDLENTPNELKPTSTREWSAFNRSFANKTNGMKNAEVRHIEIFTADSVYYIKATRYMQGTVIDKISIDDYRKDEYIYDTVRDESSIDWENETNGDRQENNLLGNMLSENHGTNSYDDELDNFIEKHPEFFTNKRESYRDFRKRISQEYEASEQGAFSMSENDNPQYSISYEESDNRSFGDAVNELSTRFANGDIDESEYKQQLRSMLDEANDKYGTIPKGERPAVDVKLPKQVSDERLTRRNVRTILETGKMNNEMTATVYKDILKDTLSYVPVSDKGAMNHANQQLKSGRALGIWEATVNGTGKINKNAIACGEALLRMEAKAGNTQHVMQLIAELSEVATRAGQTVQAFSLLKKMDGIGQLYYIQKCVDRLNQDLEKKNKNSFEPVTINEELAIELANAKPGQETEAVVDMILDEIADQMPSTFLDKWNAWRYLSMLGNPRTHIRNILGNAVFVPAVKIKDTIKAGIENAAMPKNQRTASVIIGKEYKDFAKNDFKEVEDIITGNGKMNPSDAVKKRQKIFESKLFSGIEKLRKFNFDMLEKEDSIFLKMHYVRALGGFLQARGIDLNSITNEQLNKARKYAILEAQKATYRDACALANTINKASKANFAANIIIEGVLPFKKTPINIIKRGIEYSPIGALKTLTKGTYDLKREKITASQYIDGLASGLTGTGLFVVGAILSSLGVAIGGLGYDDDDALKRLNGEQEYSIELFGKSYTVDWMAPACIPFFMGVEFMNMFDDSDKSFAAAFADAGYGSLEPIINLSMLDGIRDTIAAAKYSDDENVFTSILGEAVKSYAGQALPTIAGQVARTFDSTRRSTYVSSDATGFEKAVQQFLQSSVQGKVPIWENMKQEYTNAFGETDENTNFFARLIQNMVSPGYASSVKETDVTRQLQELYNNTGETGVIPKKAPKSIYIGNGERKYLNADEYTKFNKAKGEYSKQLLPDLFESSAYKRMVYEQKAIAVKEAYAYALALAKSEVSDYELKNPYKSWKEYQDRGINIADLIVLKVTDMDADGSGSVSKEEYAEAVSNTDMSDAEKKLLIGINDNKSKSDYKAKKIGAFKEGKWFKKEGGKYVEITSSKELVELRRNGITTYELTNAKTSAIEEMWRIFEENNK